MEPQGQPTSGAPALSLRLLAQCLQDVLGRPPEAGVDAGSLEVLRQTAQVCAALQSLQLGGSVAASSSSGDDQQAAASAPPAAPRSDGEDAPAADAADAAALAAFAGDAHGRLGMSQADLLREALPPEDARAAALQAALPALEAELQRRCRLVAAASGYSAEDYSGLPDHLRQLVETRSQASQVEAWCKAAAQAQQAVELLTRASRLLAGLLERHKLQGQKEADEAQAAFLRCECGWLKEKIRLVQLQLQEATYTPDTVAVLRRVAEEVEGAVGAAAARLQQATLQLQQYRSLGPSFRAQAAEHAAVLQQLEETEYELREIEQFRQLARVTS
ncbi:HAUS augmin-like complex subunit 4 [Chlorella sorokiniana]|uniref:HAUS augmin-like complex subunit 4 n=1 Tax=Chlorella sorokiniana TaxID=3076 RepID=A0A2P6U1X9_CHLSO|nr:HAUS augmin-like complex subunit 4 [Chlorella sorokiniana]|eukprot:PRW60309.1 HAUS augmin-like complex subunit 4 [Chlorella sorokiniana]